MRGASLSRVRELKEKTALYLSSYIGSVVKFEIKIGLWVFLLREKLKYIIQGEVKIMKIIHSYFDYWKNIFKYEGEASLKDLLIAIAFNLLLLVVVYLIGLGGPTHWENTILNLMYFIEIVMILPTLSMIIRLIRRR